MTHNKLKGKYMSKLNTEAQVIEGVGFYYCKIQQPALKYGSQTEKEFVVDLHVDKATAKAFKKEFPKQGFKEMDYDVFVEKFGAENAIGDEEQFFIKLKKGANYYDKKNGSLLTDIAEAFRPRVLLNLGDDELEDITYTKLVGNGSKGVVQYELYESKQYGASAKLLAIKVDELVEYEGKSSDNAEKFNVLGKVKSLAENPVANKPQEVKSETPVETPESDEDW